MGTPAPTEVLAGAQAKWALNLAKPLERPGYVAELADNLLLGRLTSGTEQDFLQGDGAELNNVGRRPAKMRALLSSSALAVNVFDYWRAHGPAPLSEALGLNGMVTDLRFEYKCSNHPVGPRSPNIDVLVTLENGSRVAIEAKFAEPYGSKGHLGLAAKYFSNKDGYWAARGLLRAQRLADSLGPSRAYLDAAQLLKHMLGLCHEPAGVPFTLMYLWFDPGTPQGRGHLAEIETFANDLAGDPITFRHMTYQALFKRLTPGLRDRHTEYHDYLAARYFPEAG